MGNIQLIIDNQIADVYNGGDLLTAVTYSIGSINDIEKRENASSKTIKIPATNRNRQIFGFADDLAVTSFKGQKISMPGMIRESGTDILVGLVNLKAVQRIGNDCYFEITIIGNCGEWIDQMANSDLRTLGNDGAHLKTAAVIAAAQPGLNEYCYGLVNNGFQGGQVKIASIEDNGNGKCKCIIDGSNEVYNLRQNIDGGIYVIGYAFDVTFYNKKHFVIEDQQDYIVLSTEYMGNAAGVIRAIRSDIRTEDRPLLINVEKAFSKCFSLAGYRIHSTFCASDFFKKLFILPSTEKHLESFIELHTVKAGIASNYTGLVPGTTGTFPFNVILSGTAANYSTGSHYFTAPEAMLVNFKASFNIKGTDDFAAYVQFRVSGSPYYLPGINKVVNPITLSSTEFAILEQEAELRLSAGGHVTVEIIIMSMGGDYATVTINTDDTYIECTASTNIVKGSSVNPYEVLPDIKRIDLVKAVRHLFNLYFFTDVAMKTVYIEPRDTFYLRDKYIDLSSKLDISKQLTFEELGADVAKTLSFKYKEDTTDFALTEYKRIQGDDFSKHSVILNNRFSPTDEKAIENPLFAPTIMATMDYAGLTKSLLPKIWATPVEGDTLPEKLEDFVPRILYYGGMRDIKAGEGWNFEGAVQSEYPLFCSYDVDSVNDDSLLFKPQPLIPDLFFKHYANYIRTLNEGRKITGYFNLNAGDIQSLTVPDNTGVIIKDFRSLVFFRHRGEVHHCRLESVNDYVAGKGQSTKVVLVTDVDNISQQVAPFIHSMEFTNDTIPLGTNYANGVISKSATLWIDCRNALSGSLIAQGLVYGAGSSGMTPYRVERVFLFFDTSGLPDAALITEAYLDIYKIGGDVSQEIKVFLGTQSNILTLADFNNFGGTDFGASQPGNLGLRRIYLDQGGRAVISKTGVTKFCLRESHFDVDNYTPYTNYQSFKTYLRNSPVNYVNKLTVKYTL